MTIEIVGILSARNYSEEMAGLPVPFDAQFLRRHARAHEEAGYDRILIGQNARSADSLILAATAAACTEKLRLMIAHRPGFIAPTMAARALATLDHMSGGRTGVHIITAANDAETRNDGDYLTKDQRYHRSREYVGILRRLWAAMEPVSHHGEYYRFDDAFSEVRPVQPAIPIFWGGSSELGVRFGAELADVYAIGGGSVDRISAVIAQVRADAARHGRNPRISMSMRLVLGETDGAAWARADALVATVEAAQRARGLLGRDLGEYAERRLRNVQESDGKDGNGCLWTGLTEATQGRMQAMCLVGAPDTIVTALLDYYRVGVDNFLITGFDPLGDIALIGKSVAPQLRRLTALEPRPFAQPTVHPA